MRDGATGHSSRPNRSRRDEGSRHVLGERGDDEGAGTEEWGVRRIEHWAGVYKSMSATSLFFTLTPHRMRNERRTSRRLRKRSNGQSKANKDCSHHL